MFYEKNKKGGTEILPVFLFLFYIMDLAEFFSKNLFGLEIAISVRYGKKKIMFLAIWRPFTINA